MKLRHALICVIVASLTACAPLQRDPMDYEDRIRLGTIIDKRAYTAKSGETPGQRAAWGLLSLNPIVVLVAAAGVEDGLGKSNFFEYLMAPIPSNSEEKVIVVTRNTLNVGDCVILRTNIKTDKSILIGQPKQACER